MRSIVRYTLLLVVLMLVQWSNGKIFERCELARILRNDHGLPLNEVANWVCIAQYQSNFNSSAYIGTFDNGAHGLFQISDVYWCSPPNKGWACGVSCDKLRDDDLRDDISCIRQIYDEHQRISGDGFNAWTVYQPFCRSKADKFLQGCSLSDNHIPSTTRGYFKSYVNEVDNALSEYEPQNKPGPTKVYDKCELARELRYKHNVPLEEIPTWVCIAWHESNFNTSAIGRLNADGSGDHGLFQISDIYWCSPPGNGWACGLSCDKLEDWDITDDVKCIRTIYEEHQRISGDGFNAWAVYQPYCQGQSEQYTKDCFDEISDNSLDPYLTSESVALATNTYSYKPAKGTGKVYSPCELANELKNKHHLPEEQIATWVCIAKYESNFNTSAIGNGDHGLFQISDIYWCSPPGRGWACGLSCSDLEDNDITDDVQCIRKIYDEHQRLSGDGFNAWVVYPLHCSKGRAQKYIEECTPTNTYNGIIKPAITAPTRRTTYSYNKQYTPTTRLSVTRSPTTRSPTTRSPPTRLPTTRSRLQTTTRRPFTFNSFTTKKPSTVFYSGGFDFRNTSPRPTKPIHQHYLNNFGNSYNAFKNPFSFGSAVAATNIHTTQVKPSSGITTSTTLATTYPTQTTTSKPTTIFTTTTATPSSKTTSSTIKNTKKAATFTTKAVKATKPSNTFLTKSTKPTKSTTPQTTRRITTPTTAKLPSPSASQSSTKNIFDMYFALYNITPSYKRETINRQSPENHYNVKQTTTIRPITTTSRIKKSPTYQTTTTKSSKVIPKYSFSNPTKSTTTTKSTQPSKFGFRIGLMYTPTTQQSVNIKTSTVTNSAYDRTTSTKSQTKSPFSFNFNTKSSSGRTQRDTKGTSSTTSIPLGNSFSTTKSPITLGFKYLSAPLPTKNSTLDVTKSWFDEIFDRFKH